jgi:putative transcriptional regulator
MFTPENAAISKVCSWYPHWVTDLLSICHALDDAEWRTNDVVTTFRHSDRIASCHMFRQNVVEVVARAVLDAVATSDASLSGKETTAMMGQRTANSAIGQLRQRLSMTQEEFAHAIGVTVSTVNRWENGHIEPSRLARKAMQSLATQAAIPVDFEAMHSPLIGHVSKAF